MVEADGAGADVHVVGRLAIDNSDGGVIRIKQDVLVQAGLGAVPPSELRVLVDGVEVAAYVKAWNTTFRPRDYVLFHAPAGATSVELARGEDALRMEEVYAAPVDGEAGTWVGVAGEDGTLRFGSSSDAERYFLMGFSGAGTVLLDVTVAGAEKLLYGYAEIVAEGDSGIYFSPAAGSPANFIAVSSSSVIDVTRIDAP